MNDWKRKYIRDIKPDRLKIEYGPLGSGYPGNLNFLTEIQNRLNLGTFPIGDISIEPVHHIPLDPSLYSDFSDRHREGYAPVGSMGFRAFRPDGKEASIYIVNFYHCKDNHHNPTLWWRDFDGKPHSCKSIPYHDSVSLDEPLQMKLTFGEDVIVDEFDSTKELKRKKQLSAYASGATSD